MLPTFQPAAGILAAFLLLALPAFGQEVVSLERSDDRRAAHQLDSYWTPERMQNARSLAFPLPNLQDIEEFESAVEQEMEVLPEDLQRAVGEGAAPLADIRPHWQRLHSVPKEADEDSDRQVQSDPALEPRDRGTFAAHFSSTRLHPQSAVTAYPYRTVGKLFLTIPGEGDFVCSGAVLRPRIVVTAGHCVHNGKGSQGFFTNFLFVPAYLDGQAPYRRWEWQYVVVSGAWGNGGGTLPNAADVAMFEMQDLTFNGQVRKIGEITGYLGYQTRSLNPNHVHMLGYPSSMDSGRKMHVTSSATYRTRAPNAVEYGSDMTPGSSGGPWVQNLGWRAAGQTSGQNAGVNRIVGIMSYGYTNLSVRLAGSSHLDNRFLSVLDDVCGHRFGNCP